MTPTSTGTVAQDNATLARRIYTLFSNDDFDGVLALAAEDVEIVFVPAGQTFRGHEGFMQFMQGFKSAFPDIRLTVTNQVATEDHVVTEFIASGTHTGPLLTPAGEIPATGKSAEWPVCEVWETRNGKLISIHNYQDLATMLRQLGLIS
ncbi:MAG TPA: ester cyclase [Chloroflexia bacterium]|nr:ester cyclase [Chloroflexia bacterium]